MKKNALKLILMAIIMIGSFGIVKNAWAALGCSGYIGDTGTYRSSGLDYSPTSDETVSAVKFHSITSINGRATGKMWANIRNHSTHAVIATSTLYDVWDLTETSACSAVTDIPSTEQWTFQFADTLLASTTDYEFTISADTGLINYQTKTLATGTYDVCPLVYQTVAGAWSHTPACNPGTLRGYMEVGTYSALTAGDEENSMFWYFPNNGYEVANGDWTDWSIYYNMTDQASSSYSDWYIKVTYHDSRDQYYIDTDKVTRTPDLTNWTIARSVDLEEGTVQANAEMWVTNDCNDAGDIYCTWSIIAETGWITFTASTTGFTLIDNPYMIQPGFSPATTTGNTDDDEDLGGTFGIFQRIFPLSIYYQVKRTFNDVLNEDIEESSVTFNDFLPAEYTGVTNSSVILDQDIVFNNLPLWENKVYPFMQKLIYVFAFLIILFNVLLINKFS